MESIELVAAGERFEALACGPAAGPPLLFLHGFPDVPATWAPVMGSLAREGYRCVAPYARGYGGSTRAGPFDVDRIGDDAIALAAVLAPEAKVAVLGHDWGAVAAYSAVARAPERFAAAVTVAVPHPGLFVPGAALHPRALAALWYMAFFQLPRRPERALLEGGLLERLWRDWSPGFEPPTGHVDAVRRALVAGELRALDYYRALPRSMLRLVPRWPRVRVPTLHVHGRNDGCVSPVLARGSGRFFEADTLTVLVDAGHFAPLECPDEIAALALGWLHAHPS